MTHRVIITEPAEHQLEAAARWWAEHRSAEQAVRWYAGFVDALDSLATQPERCGLARENGSFPFEIRELHYGLGHRVTHRAVFTIWPDMVLVLAIRHAAQPDLSPDDI